MNDTTDVAALYLIIGSIIFNGMTCLTGINAGYGRYRHTGAGGIGFEVDNGLAWFIWEIPNLLLPMWYLSSGKRPENWTATLCLGMFMVHYINRTLIYPWLIRGKKKCPAAIILSAFCWSTMNGMLQGVHNLYYQGSSRLLLPGLIFFSLGIYINIESEGILRNLRQPGETGYKIPRGGMFKWVSCPNYLGECVEWIGYAIASGFALPPLGFAIFTVGFVGGRAISHHDWYKKKFKDYPTDRKAIIPFLL